MIIPDEARLQLSRAVENASTAGQRADVVRAYARDWSVSEATARRHAGIRIRPSAPRTPDANPAYDQVVGLWLSSATEKYDTATMSFADAIDMAETAGLVEHGAVSVGQLRRYVHEHRITLADQRRGMPHVQLRSEHPNHVHMADVSRCRQWYLKSDGRITVQSYRQGTAEYRNKDLRQGEPLFRYVLVDHTSGLPYVQYTTESETAVTLLTFLGGAWLPKRQRREIGPTGVDRWWPAPFEPHGYDEWAALPLLRDYYFRAAPRILVLDRASANQSEFTAQLCRRLGINLIIAQEARAKGAVEAMMWIWERKFEARLATQPAPDLKTLNVWALDYLAHWCRDAVHSRHGMTRSQAWGQVQPEQLRELPAWPVFQELARREPEPRTVKSGDAGYGVVYHEGRAWRFPCDSSLIGQVVHVSHSAFHVDQLEARTGDGRVLLLEQVKRDRWGFSVDAPVIGERFTRHSDTATQQTEKRLEAVRAAMPALVVFGREGEKRDVPTLLPPRQGAEIAVSLTGGTREITEAQFNRRARAELGGRAFTDDEAVERDRRWLGVTTLPEASVDEFVAWCVAHEAEQHAVPSPKVVNLFR